MGSTDSQLQAAIRRTGMNHMGSHGSSDSSGAIAATAIDNHHLFRTLQLAQQQRQLLHFLQRRDHHAPLSAIGSIRPHHTRAPGH